MTVKLLLFFSLLIPCVSIAQQRYEIGLYGSSHINGFEGNLGTRDPLLYSGYSIGLRAARLSPATDLQAAVLFTRMDVGSISTAPTALMHAGAIQLQTECLEIQTIFRHNFTPHKKVIPFISAGLSNYFFTKEVNYNSKADPNWFEHNNELGNTHYNASVLATIGIRCLAEQTFSIDLEPNFKYFIFRNTNYRHQLAAGLAVTCSYKFKGRPLAIEE